MLIQARDVLFVRVNVKPATLLPVAAGTTLSDELRVLNNDAAVIERYGDVIAIHDRSESRCEEQVAGARLQQTDSHSVTKVPRYSTERQRRLTRSPGRCSRQSLVLPRERPLAAS